MSSVTADLMRLHPDKDERLLAASSAIVKLEQQLTDAKSSLAIAIGTLEGLSVLLREPPVPMPKTAASIDKTVSLLRINAFKLELRS